MKVLLVEDELPASKRLISLLKQLEPTWEILAVKDEVRNSIEWLKTNPPPDVIFMDIQLADGYSFSIFDEINIRSQVIFVTAFDQFAVKAFEVNGLDYLLKPIQIGALARSIDRFKEQSSPEKFNMQALSDLVYQREKSYKERFLIKSGDNLRFVRVEEIAYFISEASYSFLVTKSGNRYIIDQTLEQIENALNPRLFFRINRKQIISLESIGHISNFVNNRLKIELVPQENTESIVSRTRVVLFKEWLNK